MMKPSLYDALCSLLVRTLRRGAPAGFCLERPNRLRGTRSLRRGRTRRSPSSSPAKTWPPRRGPCGGPAGK